MPWLADPPEDADRCYVVPVIASETQAHRAMQTHAGHGADRCEQVRAGRDWLRDNGLLIPDTSGWWQQ